MHHFCSRCPTASILNPYKEKWDPALNVCQCRASVVMAFWAQVVIVTAQLCMCDKIIIIIISKCSFEMLIVMLRTTLHILLKYQPGCIKCEYSYFLCEMIIVSYHMMTSCFEMWAHMQAQFKYFKANKALRKEKPLSYKSNSPQIHIPACITLFCITPITIPHVQKNCNCTSITKRLWGNMLSLV